MIGRRLSERLFLNKGYSMEDALPSLDMVLLESCWNIDHSSGEMKGARKLLNERMVQYSISLSDIFR